MQPYFKHAADGVNLTFDAGHTFPSSVNVRPAARVPLAQRSLCPHWGVRALCARRWLLETDQPGIAGLLLLRRFHDGATASRGA